jgi:hypothetical protein
MKGRNRVELKSQAEYRMLVTGMFPLDRARIGGSTLSQGEVAHRRG